MIGMRRVYALVLVALLSGACSAGADKPFTPVGAGSGAPASQGGKMTPATPRTADPSAAPTGTQTLAIGPDFRVRVEWPSGLDPARMAMIRTFVDAYTADWKAIVSGGRDDSYRHVLLGDAAKEAYDSIKASLDGRESMAGTAKLYSLQVAALFEGKGAEVTGCVDLSGMRAVDPDTGRDLPTQSKWYRMPKAVFFQSAGMRKGDDGAWRVDLWRNATYPDSLAKECRR